MKTGKSSFVVVAIQTTTIIRLIAITIMVMTFLFLITGFLTSLRPEYRISSNSVNEATKQMAGKTLYRLLGKENRYFLASLPDEKTETASSQFLQYVTNIKLDDPRSLLGHELPGFSLFDGDILVAGEGTNYTNMPIESEPSKEALEKDAEVNEQAANQKAPSEGNQAGMKTKGNVMYIYFSHNRESYLPLLKGVTNPNSASNSKVNVTLVGERLKHSLETKGIGTIVDKTDVYGLLQKNNLLYPSSYTQSRKVVQEAMANNKDIKYLIDIHRDSQRKKVTTTTINGKSYAKLGFVIGGENPNYEKNLKLANELHKRLMKKHPGLSRGIFEKRGATTNGKFNQDLSGNAMLIEVGGVDNNLEELNRTMDVFADVLADFYWDAKAVNGD